MNRFKYMIVLICLILLCSTNAVIVRAQSVEVTEGDSFYVEINCDVLSGAVNGVGFELIYDSTMIRFVDFKDSPFSIKSVVKVNGKEGHLSANFIENEGAPFTTDIICCRIGFYALPVPGGDPAETVLNFINAGATLDGEVISSEFVSSECVILQLNQVKVYIQKSE